MNNNNIGTIDEFYGKHGYNINNFEGYSAQCFLEKEFLKYLVLSKIDQPTLNILEIGFNAGHSSDIFLSSHPTCKVVSFDILCHDYLAIGKKYIDSKYPKRHMLIIGDSRVTIPTYESNIKFDIIFIDGGHEDDVPEKDLRNCQRLSHPDSIIVMNDVKHNHINGFNIMPSKAWKDLIDEGLISEIDHHDFSNSHGLAYGKYRF